MRDSLSPKFTELIYNTDPNLGNFLVTGDWRLHLIDFTRAFRRQKRLRRPDSLGPRLDRRVYTGLRHLSQERLTQVMGDLLREDEIEGLLARRDLILDHFNRLIAEQGEAAVLYDGGSFPSWACFPDIGRPGERQPTGPDFAAR